MFGGVATAVGTTFGSFVPSSFAAAGAVGSSSSAPIVVVGAGGKTGRLVLEKLKARGLYAVGVTRNGRDLGIGGSTISYGSGDVTKVDTLQSAFKGASGVVFTASASKKGGDAAHVDYLGVANTAKAALDNQVPRLVVVSSGAVTRPESIGFKITNVFGRIMDYKIAGEEAMREAYAAAPAGGKCSYTVVRPGGLSDKPSAGAKGVEVGQGDILSAEIGREDVAEVTVAVLLSAQAKDATIECYGSAGETMFGAATGASKLAKTLPEVPAKFIHRADSFEGLLEGVLSDSEMAKTGIVGGYKGSKIEPLNKL